MSQANQRSFILVGIGLVLAQLSVGEVPQDDYYVELSIEESRVVDGVADYGTVAGMRPGATDGFDVGADEPETPPPPQDYVRCYFFHDDWSSEFGTDFNVDYREPYDLETETKIWLMQLETDHEGSHFEICFDLHSGSADTAPMVLHDLDQDEWYNLLAESCIEILAESTVRQFDLYIGVPPETVLFVSPDGGGQYATIQAAIDASIIGGTVFLSDGIYSGEGNRDLDFLGKSIALRSSSGVADSCVIDCQGTESETHRGILFQSGESLEATVEGVTITGGYSDEGGAIKCENGSSPTIRNCVLRDNYGTSGGAIYCESSSPTFENCTVSYNTSPIAGAAFLLYSSPTFENCILSHSNEGSAVFGYESYPVLYCTDVVWNEGGDWIGCIADQQNQNGNFSNTPAFCDPEDGDYRLQPGSPCLPEHNDCGVLVGALGEGDCAPTGVVDFPGGARVSLAAYPNPFNPHLTIRFSLPTEAEGTLIVYDVTGRQVRVLKTGQLTQSANEIVWYGQDDHGQDVASGVYFVRLVSGEHEVSRKAVLLH